MTEEEKKEMDQHLKEKVGRLRETVQHGATERAHIKENLASFHVAVNQREEEIRSNISKAHTAKMDALELQMKEMEEVIKRTNSQASEN